MACGAEVAPSGGVGAEIGGAAFEVLGNLARHQVAVLVAALVGLAFDVQVDPAGGGVAVGGAEGLDGFARGPGVVGGGFVERDAFEPGLALERAAVGDGEQDLHPARGWR